MNRPLVENGRGGRGLSVVTAKLSSPAGPNHAEPAGQKERLDLVGPEAVAGDLAHGGSTGIVALSGKARRPG
ncbi:hypothetical protein NKI20_26340 [Mesorhizobium sp. M0830]|uniref:hypothetical protein n=1 Tax=Mesorhizobium sp. M0830 TaxID=2957008 RepID=UPI00333B12E7